MKTIKERKKEFLLMFGHQIPKWKDCPMCGSKLSCEFMTVAHASCCPKCMEKKEEEARKNDEMLGSKSETTFSFRKYKEITSIFKDKRTGQLVGVDEKGRKVDMKNTRYNLPNDKYGWKATGKRVKER